VDIDGKARTASNLIKVAPLLLHLQSTGNIIYYSPMYKSQQPNQIINSQ
jgi:hypothetical protein|tara:strand:- start:152 stop:298 length:147 start_codon:yes stop_codon:yes gene_type:complete